jgi:hypothetical protein
MKTDTRSAIDRRSAEARDATGPRACFHDPDLVEAGASRGIHRQCDRMFPDGAGSACAASPLDRRMAAGPSDDLDPEARVPPATGRPQEARPVAAGTEDRR